MTILSITQKENIAIDNTKKKTLLSITNISVKVLVNNYLFDE